MPGYDVNVPSNSLTPMRRKRIFCVVCDLLIRDALRVVGSEGIYCRSCYTNSCGRYPVVKDAEVDEEVNGFMLFVRTMEDLQREKQTLTYLNDKVRREISELWMHLKKKEQKLLDKSAQSPLYQSFSTLSEDDNLQGEVFPNEETIRAFSPIAIDKHLTEVTPPSVFEEEDYDEESSSAVALQHRFDDTENHLLTLIQAENMKRNDIDTLHREADLQQKRHESLKRLDAVEEKLPRAVKCYHSALEEVNQTPSLLKSSLVTGSVMPFKI